MNDFESEFNSFFDYYKDAEYYGLTAQDFKELKNVWDKLQEGYSKTENKTLFKRMVMKYLYRGVYEYRFSKLTKIADSREEKIFHDLVYKRVRLIRFNQKQLTLLFDNECVVDILEFFFLKITEFW